MKLFTILNQLSNKQRLGILALLIVLFAASTFIPRNSGEEVVIDSAPSVSLVNVGDTSTDSSPLYVTGSVRSETEAQLRTETQGEVIGVYTNVGSFVTAGTVIAELRNNAERASVEQAKALLEIAFANLEKGIGGARSEERTILEINLLNAENTYTSAKQSVSNTLQSTYATIDDAISARTDSLFSNPGSSDPVFNLATSDFKTVNRLRQTRTQITDILDRQSNVQTGSNKTDLISELEMTFTELQVIKDFLDDILVAINNAIPTVSVSESAIALFKADAIVARTSIHGALVSITGTRSILNNAQALLDIAIQNLERGITGAQEEDVRTLEAQVNQARAGLSQATARLTQTLIVSPISGTINTLSLRRGEFVTAFSPAATISNNNALEIETYITSNDSSYVRVGSYALIDNQYEGIVTSIAPGLDPVTKKIEVRIGVIATNTTLTNGSSVRLEIERNGFHVEDTDIKEITIPISALKIETNRTIVFTVSSKDVLVAIPVVIGLVLGDNLIIEDGLAPHMNIVKDARGLREGQKVISNSN